MNIVLKKCVLREWRWEDKDSLIKNADNIKVARMVKDRFPYPYDETAADNWLKIATHDFPQTNFAIVIKDQAVGGISFESQGDIFRRSAEIGYWLGEDYWNKGVMTEAVKAITAFAFQNFDLCRLYAGVFATNPASVRVLEKSGYIFEGRLRKSITKFGQTIDQLLFAKVL
ncbi:MAG: GNAT family N-acetyltransferase [Peptococcaceae bacterium]|nr:GNAT family N-acetyltransferase [Peptococcaceae bacterium]